jgi:hypothetical protein
MNRYDILQIQGPFQVVQHKGSTFLVYHSSQEIPCPTVVSLGFMIEAPDPITAIEQVTTQFNFPS